MRSKPDGYRAGSKRGDPNRPEIGNAFSRKWSLICEDEMKVKRLKAEPELNPTRPLLSGR
jgi:hypothetical protein